jgi:hypothetical protein
MIVRDHRGKYYRVFEITGGGDDVDTAMNHLWHGLELRYLRKGIYHEYRSRAGKQRWTYVAKHNAQIVQE